MITLPPRRSRSISQHPFAVTLHAAGVGISDAARSLGISRSYLSAILHGTRRPGPELAARMDELAAALAEESARQDAEVRHHG